MNTEQRYLIKKNLDIFLRKKKLIIFCLLLGFAGGLYQYSQAPKIYKSSSLIKYQRQTVNPTLMSPDDNRTRSREVVSTVNQQITSRSSLESIINEYDLYKGMRGTVPMEKIVEIMRNFDIETRLLEGGEIFEVSYLGGDQQKVMEVANALAQKFIEENLRFRRNQAAQTSIYIRDELKIAKEALDKKEEVMRDYKLRYYNEMPEQLLNNTNRLNALQEQYQNLQNNRLELERTRLLVQEQIAERNSLVSQQFTENNVRPQPEVGNVANADQIRLRLQSLEGRYRENHPEIKRLKKLLGQLETEQTEPSGHQTNSYDPQTRELRQQLKDIEFNISRIGNERKSVNGQIKQYEQWISATPIREAEWAALTRDYEQLNEYYQRLVTQSLQAESAQSLEDQQQGSQFIIVDKAYLPEKPISPDFKRILLLAVILGVGAGGAVSFGIELLGTSFKDPNEMEKYLDLPVICALPIIQTRKEILWQKTKGLSSSVMLILLAGSLAYATYYMFENDMIIL